MSGQKQSQMKLVKNKAFRDLTTFRIGGKIKYFVEVNENEKVKEVVDFAKNNKLPIFVLGSGSDILVSDKEFKGLVVKYTGKKVTTKHLKGSSYLITSEAGTIWDYLVKYSVNKNLQGIECLSGIPGTVGASPIQNIGAYGQELKDVFVSLSAYDIQKEKFVKLRKTQCGFSYRESIFKSKKYWQKYIITEVTLKLTKNKKPKIKYDSLKNYFIEHGIKNPSLKQVRTAVCRIRAGKFENPSVVPNAGSFFKNPIFGEVLSKKLAKSYPQMPLIKQADGRSKGFAGWFIENAGWKGKSFRGAGTSPRHALILINKSGKAKADDLVILSRKIISDVFKKFGVRLEREVQLINFGKLPKN